MIPSFIAPAWIEYCTYCRYLFPPSSMEGNHPHLEAYCRYVAHLTLLLVALLPTSNRLAPAAQHRKFLPQASSHMPVPLPSRSPASSYLSYQPHPLARVHPLPPPRDPTRSVSVPSSQQEAPIPSHPSPGEQPSPAQRFNLLVLPFFVT